MFCSTDCGLLSRSTFSFHRRIPSIHVCHGVLPQPTKPILSAQPGMIVVVRGSPQPSSLRSQVSTPQSPISSISPLSFFRPPALSLISLSFPPQPSSLSSQPSSLSPPVSALSLQVSALSSQSPLPHSVQKRLNNAYLTRIQRLFLRKRPTVVL